MGNDQGSFVIALEEAQEGESNVDGLVLGSGQLLRRYIQMD